MHAVPGAGERSPATSNRGGNQPRHQCRSMHPEHRGTLELLYAGSGGRASVFIPGACIRLVRVYRANLFWVGGLTLAFGNVLRSLGSALPGGGELGPRFASGAMMACLGWPPGGEGCERPPSAGGCDKKIPCAVGWPIYVPFTRRSLSMGGDLAPQRRTLAGDDWRRRLVFSFYFSCLSL